MNARIEEIGVRHLTFPTSAPFESDGTLTWQSTTMLLVQTRCQGRSGIGYSYTHACAAQVVEELQGVVTGQDALSPRASWEGMLRKVRNYGRQGIAASAISAIDISLWDLKAKLLNLPLTELLGQTRSVVPAYASGGFTNLDGEALEAQLLGWRDAGFRSAKIKIGDGEERDLQRVEHARRILGPEIELMVDANGAYQPKPAIRLASDLVCYGVRWFEEPVSSDDLEGLRRCRQGVPASVQVTAGEYAWDWFHFRDLLTRGAVDVAQIDATRCLGITGFLRCAALCESFGVPISLHTVPSVHAHLACAVPSALHVEWFHDHRLIEERIFTGTPQLTDGTLEPPPEPGLGLDLVEDQVQEVAA